MNKVEKLAESEWGAYPICANGDHTRVLLSDMYTLGDGILYLLEDGKQKLLYGKPINERADGEAVPLNGLGSAAWTPSGSAVLVINSIFDDHYSLGLIDLMQPGKMQQVGLDGLRHHGVGEMTSLEHLKGLHYLVQYNIDGCSWVYDGVFNEAKANHVAQGLRHRRG